MDRLLRIETILHKVLNLDIYVREMMELNLAEMNRIKYHHHKTVNIDTEVSSYNTEEEDEANADDDCEHVYCHRISCKIDPARNIKRQIGKWKTKEDAGALARK